ncbi:hypothetical protein ZYGR_0AM00100 [Zygosaccharomyces rouxii]|uniref:non-specific serine/threonine protein kinase n=1 Tax=Zygosaccharomyces rouxii TaxID=4956 RepID=A0A1Q3AFM0_ZYGRO|nr:hypothetical protein ZYGR_0AM00100 [Zygosaccharomyces rouxii]
MNRLKNFFKQKKTQQEEEELLDQRLEQLQQQPLQRGQVQGHSLPPSTRAYESRISVEEDTLSSTTKVNSERSTMETQAANNYHNNSTNNQCQSMFVEDVGSSRTSSSDDSYGPSDEEDEDEDDEDDIPEDIFPEQAEIDGYTLVNKIGEGAFSTVFRGVVCKGSGKAFLANNFKNLAIKVIRKQDIPDSSVTKKDAGKTSTRAQVLKEVTIHKLAASGCPEIVQFIDFQETENYYFIVQEFLSGGEIFGEIVKYTYFSEDLSRHIIRQLALAVKHLHNVGVVHRDIKPENLLFEPIDFVPSKKIKLRKSDDPSTKKDEGIFRPGLGGGGIGSVKLADFGLSKQIYQTKTKTPCGTVGYTAPEVVKDEKYSTKVDMWGIGCVLYTILCGFPPFYDEKIDTLTEKISRGEYVFLRPWWDEISDGAKTAVKRLLEVDPVKRYDIDEFLNDSWLNTFDCLEEQREEEERIRSHKRKSKLQFKKRMAIDSTLLYSPAAVAMKDAFDVSNAVQRDEEDKREIMGNSLGALAEDEESDDIRSAAASSAHANGDNNQDLSQDMFHLSLDSSTIIKRRKNGVVPIATVVE